MAEPEEVHFVGKETLAEFSGCKNIFLTARTFKKHAVAAAKAAGATVKEVAVFHNYNATLKNAVNSKRVAVAHTFSPAAITVVVVLAESHIAIHTWPEFDFIAVDIFTCGKNAINDKAIEYLKKIFKPEDVETETFPRKVKIFARQ